MSRRRGHGAGGGIGAFPARLRDACDAAWLVAQQLTALVDQEPQQNDQGPQVSGPSVDPAAVRTSTPRGTKRSQRSLHVNVRDMESLKKILVAFGAPKDDVDPCGTNEALRAVARRMVEKGNEELANIEWVDGEEEESEGM